MEVAMKRQWFAAIAVILMVLPACATNGPSQFARNERIVVDAQYVNEVNNASRVNGVNVTWVNPPTKRVRLDSNSND